MQDSSLNVYQILTYVMVGLIVFVCMCYLLIFINPQISVNPFKPPIPTATTVAFLLPPTWTPI